ncbi:o-succinylbenzoate--CoA ligase [Actinobacillus delphinicola]|uniref:O-succinylbenzoic acid--CoA ligase n=1 Tax=Actinobacillus delphinicola TaxID=51161 RepID=A0A448TRZ9_9PAST|nr:o-succinylbenzoate--CoA ligase [Actinobacillus delphinicola]VEJ08686.1 O-succinylbenzoic acid--CoA ligase [Actinobacillus delphinicola]
MNLLWQDFANCGKNQNRIALRDSQGNLFSWKEVTGLISTFAEQLKQQGIKKGSGVALCGRNSENLVFLYLATIQLGARALGINPAFSAQKCASIFENSQIDFYYLDPTAIHLQQDLKKFYENRGVELNLPPYLDLISPTDNTDNTAISNFTEDDYHHLPITMTLTSGSTGLPKAVVHSLQAHLENAAGVCDLMQFQATDSYLLSLPIYHVSGQGIIWRWLQRGAVLHFVQDDFYDSLSQVTHASLVPTQAQRFLQYLVEHPTKTYRTKHLLLGGASIPVALTQALAQANIQSYCGYGMTEMASTIFAKKADASSGVGQPLPKRIFKLVNDEICLKGAGLALGYWQKDGIHPLTNGDGFFATKDKGVWKNNELFIIGRVDNQFISGGENIQPEEIESILKEHPLVKQVFVLPIADKEFGHRPVAMIELNTEFNEENILIIKAWLKGKLEKFKHPIAYYLLESEKFQSQGSIKISRNLLQKELEKLI